MAGAPERYRDPWIICTDSQLVIRRYYFPFGRPKAIPYADIRAVTPFTMGAFTGKGRFWGTASPRSWAHLDCRRPRKQTALILDLGRRVRPFITPADPERVAEIIGLHHRV